MARTELNRSEFLCLSGLTLAAATSPACRPEERPPVGQYLTVEPQTLKDLVYFTVSNNLYTHKFRFTPGNFQEVAGPFALLKEKPCRINLLNAQDNRNNNNPLPLIYNIGNQNLIDINASGLLEQQEQLKINLGDEGKSLVETYIERLLSFYIIFGLLVHSSLNGSLERNKAQNYADSYKTEISGENPITFANLIEASIKIPTPTPRNTPIPRDRYIPLDNHMT